MGIINKRIGFIGCGNMGSAVLAGLLNNQLARNDQVFVYDIDGEKVRVLKQTFDVQIAEDNADIAKQTQVIVLAIKPQDLGILSTELKSILTSNQTVISILAGTPISKLKKFVGTRASIVRAMPNLGAQVDEAMTAITGSDREALAIAQRIFSGCGQVVQLPERFFDLVTAISGSGPAYFFLMIELLAKFGEEEGLEKKTAELLAIQTAIGAGLLAKTLPYSPEKLREMVTSKRGTTAAALSYFDEKGLKEIFIEGVRKAAERSRELSKS